MAANRIESPKPEGGAAPAAAAGGAAGAAPAAGKSGIMAWMPVIANLVLMPVLAYVTTVYLIAPKLKPAAEAEDSTEEGAAAEHGKPASKESAKDAGKEHGKAAPKESKESSKEHGKSSGGHGESKGGKGAKASVALSKSILVNVMGSMGTRYIMGSFTLVGTGGDFEGKVKENDAQLRDAAAGVMSSKTLQDLEKPGARNLVRTELITVFNSILGGKVQDIFMTEFAVQ